MILIQSVLILNSLLTLTAGADVVKYAQVGDRVTLEPPVGTDLKVHYLYWTVGGEEVAWTNTMGKMSNVKPWTELLSDGSLVIKNIKDEYFRSFLCKVTKYEPGRDKFENTHTYKVLKVNVTMNPPSPLLPEENLTLICNVESPQGHKKPEIHWLDPQTEKIGRKGSVTVKVTGQHNGRWTCVVKNDIKEHHATVAVMVVDLSPAPTSPQYTSKSWPLTIPCSIHASWEQIKAKGIQEGNWHFIPKPGSSLTPGPQRLFSLSLEDKLAWKADQNRGLTPSSDLTKGNLSLMRKQGREDDSGDYVCSLNFKNGRTLNRTVHVKVLQIISSPGTELISGQQLNLTCSLSHSLPSDLRLRWFPPEHSSLSSLTSDRHPARLTIPEVGSGDSGKWRCELWQSDTRLTSADITLKIEPKLSVWMIVIICSVTAIVILLILIFVCIAYRRRQRKMRHLSHRLCQCKTPKPKGFYRT